VCKALKVKVASLNLMRHSIGSQWSCLRSTSEDSGIHENTGTGQPELLPTGFVEGELCF